MEAARKVFTEGQRLGYRLDASAMSGRLRKRASLPVTASTGYSKRCQRDLNRFYNKALKEAENHFSTSFPSGNTKDSQDVIPSQNMERRSSFTVLKNIPLCVPEIKSSIPIKSKRIVKKQKSLSFAKIRHSCNEVIHLSIDCSQLGSGEDNSNTDTACSHRSSDKTTPRNAKLLRRQSAEKRVKFKKSSRTNSESGGDGCVKEVNNCNSSNRANYLMQRNQQLSEKREKDYLNELFHSKTGEIERDVQGFVRLNYTLIGKYLSYDNSSYKHKLLQALRWRLNLNEKLTQRTIQDFMKYDLLRIKNNQYYERTLIEMLLWPMKSTTNANNIQNSMVRLLNGIVSYEEGRNYIGTTSIVNHLIWGGENELYKVEPSRQFIDSGTAGMLLATMMKLSTNPWQKKDMLNRGILSWTLGHLEDIEYSGTVLQTKYTLSLLNSILRLPEAVEELTPKTAQVLVLLARYLRRERSEWFFTVKCILVKLFKHKQFRQAAKEMNFETLLRKLINPMDFKAKKELEFIILYLNDSGNITQLPCSASLFEVEEKIVFDAEIESEDGIVHLPGLEGELLLEEQFAKYKIVYQDGQGREGNVIKNRASSMHRVFPVDAPEKNNNRSVMDEPICIKIVTEERKDEQGVVMNIETQLNPDLPIENVIASKEDVVESSTYDKVSVNEQFMAMNLTDNFHGVEEGVRSDNEAEDDDNDVVIGKLEDEGESSKRHKIVIIPPSESESPVSVARTFPHSLSISSLSSLEEVVEPRTWSQFPMRKRM